MVRRVRVSWVRIWSSSVSICSVILFMFSMSRWWRGHSPCARTLFYDRDHLVPRSLCTSVVGVAEAGARWDCHPNIPILLHRPSLPTLLRFFTFTSFHPSYHISYFQLYTHDVLAFSSHKFLYSEQTNRMSAWTKAKPKFTTQLLCLKAMAKKWEDLAKTLYKHQLRRTETIAQRDRGFRRGGGALRWK